MIWTVPRSTNANKYMKKCSTALAINRNASQKYTEIPSHPSQNGNHEENKEQQMLIRMWVGERRKGEEPSYTVGGNVN
jgi:hypothetical protein